MKEKVVFFWSGGKDSSICLHKVLQNNAYEVAALITTINKNFGRVSMHGVREELIEEQAKSIGIPLHKMYVNEGTNNEYENVFKEALMLYKSKGIKKVIFGDIFLEDLKLYRDKLLEEVGMEGIYPLWKLNTRELLREFIGLNFKTITCCVNDAWLDKKWAGRVINENFIAELPLNVDPCGENGEYHTFCYSGPIFKNDIAFKKGEIIYKPVIIKTIEDDPCALSANKKTTGFWFCDLIPF
jgi:uncharacterized protein (TIGR00290 family)